MNFYQHHIGDFNNATRHLSRLERSVYRDLLDLYYDQEGPLADDFHRLARKVLCNSADELSALEAVLAEFFVLADGVYRNSRADREIEAYQRMANGGRRGAEVRWSKGRTFPANSQPIAPPCPPHVEANANHEPETMNHEPEQTKTLSGKPDAPDPRAIETKRLKAEAKPILEFLNAKANRAYRLTDTNVDFVVARLRDGLTPTQLRQIVAKKCREWGSDPKMESYLRPATLFNRTNCEQYVGELVPESGGMQ